jgi:hypothetical protein
MRARSVRWIAVGAGVALLAGLPAAAAGAAGPLPEDQRVSLTLFGSVNLGNPGQDFESALRAATLADDYFPLADGSGGDQSRPTPVSEGGRWAYGVALGYALAPEWEVRGLVRGEEEVSAYGVRQVLYRVQLSLEASSTRYAALIAYRPLGSVVRIGLGPALTSAEVRARDDWTEFPGNSDTRFGFLAEGAATWPLRSRFFAEAAAQYWYAGEMSYGPYDVRNGIGNIQVYFPGSKYSLDRTSLTFGAGVRF